MTDKSMIAAIGAFDGFHTGHRMLLDTARDMARSRSLSWGIVTFSRDNGMLASLKGSGHLFTSREQELLERFFDIPEIVSLPFDASLQQMTPEEFLSRLYGSFGVRGAVVGEGFHFGRDRSGSTDDIERFYSSRGEKCAIVPLCKNEHAEIISSTLVRRQLLSGGLAAVADCLSHPFFLVGTVRHGLARGRSLGFPTANILPSRYKLLPPDGVYASMVYLGDRWLPGALNIGRNPTFGELDSRQIEVNLIGSVGDIYDHQILIALTDMIRGEIRFQDQSELIAQIGSDVQQVKAISSAYAGTYAGMLERLGGAFRSI